MKLPRVATDPPELALPLMGLRDYALFSERCLRSNPHITADTCMTSAIAETRIRERFRLDPPRAHTRSPSTPREV